MAARGNQWENPEMVQEVAEPTSETHPETFGSTVPTENITNPDVKEAVDVFNETGVDPESKVQNQSDAANAIIDDAETMVEILDTQYDPTNTEDVIEAAEIRQNVENKATSASDAAVKSMENKFSKIQIKNTKRMDKNLREF